jgi:phosphate transport system permease protein
MTVNTPVSPDVSEKAALEHSARMIARNRLREKIAFSFIGLCMLIVLAGVVWLLGYIVVHGIGTISWTFLTAAPEWDGKGGVFPAIVGTIYLLIGTILLTLPLGIAGALYLSEYAGGSRLVRFIRLAIINLSGVPSMVTGLFGMGFFVFFVGGSIDRLILHTQRPVWGQPCLLWGACTLMLVILPIVITSTEEALRSVPLSFREGSLGLGASRWQTVWRVVLPSAMPGILTGAILGIGRAAGETAPVMITVAASFKPTLPSALNSQAMLLPYHLYYIVTQVPNSGLAIQSGIALVLIILVFTINISAVIARARIRRARKW